MERRESLGKVPEKYRRFEEGDTRYLDRVKGMIYIKGVLDDRGDKRQAAKNKCL